VVRAYLGLGSNLGDRAANLWEAVRRLAAVSECQVVRCSPLYETEPVGLTGQPWFLNSALAVETGLEPMELLRALKEIERAMGRVTTVRWGPRLIDLDILLYGDVDLDSDELTVPHRELWNRRFVLIPLSTILQPGPLAERVAQRLKTLGSTPDVRSYRL
jgi:2-amino-4-hydroxy-6-hydroxymethyldihydropteridine diphosphokinase